MNLIFHILNIICIVFAKDPPEWDSVHTVKGVLYIPYAEIEEPFEAWCDHSKSRSRVDYYGGTVKTYQLSEESEFGTSLKVAPVSTEQELNKITCLEVNGTAQRPIETQSVLPDCRNFQFVGTDNLLGWNCDKFELKETINSQMNSYTIYIRYVNSANEPASQQPIPVRYVMRGWDTLIGAHYDHYHLDYNFYSPNKLPSDIFDVNDGKPCVAFPGPGYAHFPIFNPMKEFIHPSDSSHVDHEHMRFMKKHGAIYNTNTERMFRQNIFMQNLRFIHSKNRQHLNFSLGVNHLTDRTVEELDVLQGRKSSLSVHNDGQPFPYNIDEYSDLPEEYDWRLYGAVTPVKDQAVCGSCWSFGATGTIEGTLFLHNGGNLIRLSEQSLVDCSWGFGNDGCNGGQEFRAYSWIKKRGGIPSDESYGGYKGQDGFCHVNDANVSLVAPISGWVNIASDAKALKIAILKHGPVNVAIDASHKSFHFYSHGVYFEPDCGKEDDELTHYVLVVGYGRMHGVDYWLVKNSFSNLWGSEGYILMSAEDNNCGVLTDATYVTF